MLAVGTHHVDLVRFFLHDVTHIRACGEDDAQENDPNDLLGGIGIVLEVLVRRVHGNHPRPQDASTKGQTHVHGGSRGHILGEGSLAVIKQSIHGLSEVCHLEMRVCVVTRGPKKILESKSFKMKHVKFSINVVAGLTAIVSALASFEAFEGRFAKLGEHRFLATMALIMGSAFSATGADVRASGISCLVFLTAFYYIPELQDAFPLLHFDDLDSMVSSVTKEIEGSIPTKNDAETVGEDA